MALSGSFQTSKESRNKGSEYPCYVYCNWSATQDIANNTSTISYTVYGGSDGTSTTKWAVTSGVSLTINGTKVFEKAANFNMTKDQILGSGTITVPHNADGSKTVDVSLKASIMSAPVSYSGNIVLNTIPRASTPSLSATTFDFGQAVTISISRASTAFTHNLSYVLGNVTYAIASGVATSASWTIPTNLVNLIPNATSIQGTLVCTTYNGSTKIGEKTLGFTATVPASAVPTISSIVVSDANGYATTYGGYVQNKSQFSVKVNASGAFGSTIQSYKIEANGNTYNSNDITTNVITISGRNIAINATITDSRGRTASSTATVNVLEYADPKIDRLSAKRTNANGQEDPDGAFIFAEGASKISSLNSKNHPRTLLQQKKVSESEWVTLYETTSGGVLPSTYSQLFEADRNSSYNVRIALSDDFGSVTKEVEVGTGFTLMDFDVSGKGMAIGKVSEGDIFDINLPTKFRNTVEVSAFYENSVALSDKYLSKSDFSSGNATVGEHNCNYAAYNACLYYTENGPSTSIGASWTDGALYSQAYSDLWVAQIAQDYRNGNLFVRSRNNGTWVAWKKVLTTECGHERLTWWSYNDAHNVDDLLSGTTFAYGNHGAPASGTISAFSATGSSGGEAYALQLMGSYGANTLYFRNRNGDSGAWHGWKQVIDNGNIGSQSVYYATYTSYIHNDEQYMRFHWNGQGGQPTWLWGGNAGSDMYVWNPSNFEVYTALKLRGIGARPNDAHPGSGATVFYSWNTGQAYTDTAGYSNGITIGSHPGDTNYGFQIVQNMWDDRTYTRRFNAGWQAWKTLAWTEELPTMGTWSGNTHGTPGTKSGWIRFPSIKMQICWATCVIMAPMAKPWGSVYVLGAYSSASATTISAGNWPQPFSDVPYTVVSPAGNPGGCWVINSGYSAGVTAINSGVYELARATRADDTSARGITIWAIGPYA